MKTRLYIPAYGMLYVTPFAFDEDGHSIAYISETGVIYFTGYEFNKQSNWYPSYFYCSDDNISDYDFIEIVYGSIDGIMQDQ